MVGVAEAPGVHGRKGELLLLRQSSTIVGAGERILVRADDQTQPRMMLDV